MTQHSPIRSIKNQYYGLNVHFHHWIMETGNRWRDFHGVYIFHILTHLRQQLRPMGYEANIEQGLQIQVDDALHYPLSDISIYDAEPTRTGQPTLPQRLATFSKTIPELLAIETTDLDYYHAISIRTVESTSAEAGKLVAWIELLSPSNKRGEGLQEYREKRKHLLIQGIVFVELDFLHRYPPTFAGIPVYKARAPRANAAPHLIITTDPRPDLASGRGEIYAFGVDDPIPTVQIPLQGNDVLCFNFNKSYQEMFEVQFYGDKVDYNTLPLLFKTYMPDDQQRLVSRLLTILTHEDDLESGPFPRAFDSLSLVEGIEKLNTLLPTPFEES